MDVIGSRQGTKKLRTEQADVERTKQADKQKDKQTDKQESKLGRLGTLTNALSCNNLPLSFHQSASVSCRKSSKQAGKSFQTTPIYCTEHP